LFLLIKKDDDEEVDDDDDDEEVEEEEEEETLFQKFVNQSFDHFYRGRWGARISCLFLLIKEDDDDDEEEEEDDDDDDEEETLFQKFVNQRFHHFYRGRCCARISCLFFLIKEYCFKL